jgi:hypothetical protein
MGMKKTNLQPGHDGKHPQVAITPGMSVNHMSHGQADHDGHHVPGNLARDGKGKLNRPVPVHGGMSKQTKAGGLALGGNHASALDALSGAAVVPGQVKAQSGWGNAGVQSGHPFARAPGSKNLRPVPVAFGQRSRGPNPDSAMHEIGQAMPDEAFANSSRDDCDAHGRKGRK